MSSTVQIFYVYSVVHTIVQKSLCPQKIYNAFLIPAKLDLAPVESDLSLVTKPDPQTFDIENRKDNAPNNTFLIKINNKNNAHTALEYRL